MVEMKPENQWLMGGRHAEKREENNNKACGGLIAWEVAMNAISKELPPGLRTEHFMNDIHHSMFLILFVNMFEAIRLNQMKVVENYIDNITLYLYIHFLSEEEGMAHSIVHHGHDPEWIAHHTGIHVKFVQFWNDTIFTPFKDGAISNDDLHSRVYGFCEKVIHHIETVDLKTYGPEARHVDTNINEAAQISISALPLSPFQPGAMRVIEILGPQVVTRLSPRSICPAAHEPMPQLTLTVPPNGLLKGTAFHDIFVAAKKGKAKIVA